MVKETRFDWKQPWNLPKPNHLFVKLGASILLMCVAFRLFFSPSITFSSVTESPSVERTAAAETHVPDGALQRETRKGKCDLFTGEWIPNPLGPIYTNESCHVVEEHQNCMKNGRPDSGYLYWRWKPRDCDLPLFDSQRFLENMRNKSWAFVGDSISRNHVQSLLCILSKVEEAVNVYHDKDFKSKSWLFPSYNFTLSVIWSPFLIKAVISEDINGVSTSEVQVYLDTLDEKWADKYYSYDYTIFSGGKWFLKSSIYWEKSKIIGCHYCPGKNLTEIGFEYSYRLALQLVLNFIATSNHKGLTFFRTSTPDHFENGEWFSGGTCNRTVPSKEGKISLNSLDEILRKIELEEFEKAAAVGLEKGVNIKLLDTNRLSLLRPDGHPGNKPLYVALAQRKEDRKARLQAQFSQMRPVAMPPSVAPRVPMYPPGAPPMGQVFYGQGPPALIPPQPGFGYQQHLVPGMRPGGAPMPNFFMPIVPQGQQAQRPGGRRTGAGPVQQNQQPVPMLQQQMLPRGGRVYRYPPGRNVPDVSMPGVAGGMLSVPYDMGAMPLRESQPIPIGALASALANATPDQQRMMLGESLYPLVDQLEHDMAAKVTGMLLEMDQTEVLHLLESPEALKAKVAEAMDVLRNVAQQQQSGSPTDQLAALSLNDTLVS